MPDENPENPKPAQKRSTLSKELHSLGELLKLLKPLDADQRKRLIETANVMLSDEP